jgi:hypothetical protein
MAALRLVFVPRLGDTAFPQSSDRSAEDRARKPLYLDIRDHRGGHRSQRQGADPRPGAWFVVNAGIAHRICAMTVAAAAVIATTKSP